jgi:uncharacterized protein DUF1579
MEFRIRVAPALLIGALAVSLACAGPVSASEKAPKKTTKAEPKTEAKAEEKAAAADKTTTPPTQEEMMAAMMKLASPGPEHAALNPLAGTWKTSTKMWGGPSGPTPEPTLSEGTCERSWVMGGRYLVGKYKGDFSGMPFEGMEVLGYDNMKKQYVSSWVDNMGTGIMLSTGNAMDPATKSFTLTGSAPDPSGQVMSMREITSIVDGNTYTMTMYGTMGGQEMKMMEITYSRLK